jgi:hypothetical protein
LTLTPPPFHFWVPTSIPGAPFPAGPAAPPSLEGTLGEQGGKQSVSVAWGWRHSETGTQKMGPPSRSPKPSLGMAVDCAIGSEFLVPPIPNKPSPLDPILPERPKLQSPKPGSSNFPALGRN